MFPLSLSPLPVVSDAAGERHPRVTPGGPSCPVGQRGTAQPGAKPVPHPGAGGGAAAVPTAAAAVPHWQPRLGGGPAGVGDRRRGRGGLLPADRRAGGLCLCAWHLSRQGERWAGYKVGAGKLVGRNSAKKKLLIFFGRSLQWLSRFFEKFSPFSTM